MPLQLNKSVTDRATQKKAKREKQSAIQLAKIADKKRDEKRKAELNAQAEMLKSDRRVLMDELKAELVLNLPEIIPDNTKELIAEINDLRGEVARLNNEVDGLRKENDKNKIVSAEAIRTNGVISGVKFIRGGSL